MGLVFRRLIGPFLIAGLAAALPGGSKLLTSGRNAIVPRTTTSTPVLIIPFHSVYDHIVVQVRINGSYDGLFLVDTGSTANMIAFAAAQQMHLPASHSQARYGVGVGEEKTELLKLKHVALTLNGVDVFTGTLFAVQMKAIAAVLKIDGILGQPFFRKYVVSIDYENRTLKLNDPNSYRYQGTGYIVPIQVKGVPFIRAEIAGQDGKSIPAKLAIDTGAGDLLSLNSPFERKHSLPRRGQVTVLSGGTGLGGAYEDRLGRLLALQIGDLTIQRPVVLFEEAQRGTSASQSFDGRIGEALLERFTVIFDYSHDQMILEPNSRFGRPFKANISQISFNHGPAQSVCPEDLEPSNGYDNFTIDFHGGLPTSAGLRAGDEVVAIDDKPADSFDRQTLENLFCEERKTITLTILRAGKKIQITFTTPKLL